MKKINIAYWIVTVLFAGFMIFTAIPDAICMKEAVDFMTRLGYPVYIIPFLGVAKILGGIAILIPGFSRIKEWAYAGLAYDLIGAMYSTYCHPDPEHKGGWAFMFIFLAVLFASYSLYHKRLKAASMK